MSVNEDELETKEGDFDDDWLMVPVVPEDENSEIEK